MHGKDDVISPTCFCSCKTGHCPHKYSVENVTGIRDWVGTPADDAKVGAAELRRRERGRKNLDKARARVREAERLANPARLDPDEVRLSELAPETKRKNMGGARGRAAARAPARARPAAKTSARARGSAKGVAKSGGASGGGAGGAPGRGERPDSDASGDKSSSSSDRSTTSDS